MGIFIIIVLIPTLLLLYLIVSGKKSIRDAKENKTYLTVDNYQLIRDSPYANMLSKYTIHRQENELRFTRKGVGYTLFFLKLPTEETNTSKLVGLDGYGIRDREFLRYTRQLVDEIKEFQEREIP